MKLYKLTDQNHETHGRTKWGPGIAHETNGEGELCGRGWIHAYTHPLLALLLDPIHGNFGLEAVLWEAKGEGLTKEDHGLKVGVTRLTTVRQIEKPAITMAQRVRFGLLCALKVYRDAKFVKWAEAWLAGTDRSETAAEAAARAAEAAGAAAEAVEVGKLDLIALAKKAMEEEV